MQIIKQKHVHATSLILVNSKQEVIASNYHFVEYLAPRKPKKKSGGSKYFSIKPIQPLSEKFEEYIAKTSQKEEEYRLTLEDSKRNESDYIVSMSKIYTSKIFLIKITSVSNQSFQKSQDDNMLHSNINNSNINNSNLNNSNINNSNIDHSNIIDKSNYMLKEDDMQSEMNNSMFGNTYLSKNLRKLKVNYKDLKVRFTFSYDPLNDQYLGEFKEKNKIKDTNYGEMFQRSIQKRLSKIDASEESKKNDASGTGEEEEIYEERQKFDYSKGIRTMRLNGENRLVEIFDDYSEDEESDLDKERVVFGKKSQGKNSKGILSKKGKKKGVSNASDFEDFEHSSYFRGLKNDQTLLKAVNKIHISKQGIIINFLSFLAVIGFGILGYLLISKEKGYYSTILTYTKILDITYEMFGDCSTISSSVDNLLLYNKNYPPNNLAPVDLESDSRMRLIYATDFLTQRSQDLLDLINSPGMEAYIETLTEKGVMLSYGNNSTVNVTLRESINQLTSACINIYNLDLDKIKSDNSDVSFVMTNSLNAIQLYLIIKFLFNENNQSKYVEMAEKEIKSATLYIIIYCCSFFIIMFWMLYIRLKNQDKIIDLFYGYNMNDCKIINKKCEHALQEFLAEGVENLDLNLEFLEDLDNEKERIKLRREEESEIILISRSKKKGKFARRLYLPTLMISLIFGGIYSFSLLSEYFYENSSTVDFEIANTNFQLIRLERLVEAGTLSLKASAIDNNRRMWFAKSPFTAYLSFWNVLVIPQTLGALDNLSQKYQMNEDLGNLYVSMFNSDFCQYLIDKNIQDKAFVGIQRMKCENIYGGILKQGMNLGFRTHISNLYDEMLKFQYYNNTENPKYLGNLACEKPTDKTPISQRYFECSMKENIFREIGKSLRKSNSFKDAFTDDYTRIMINQLKKVILEYLSTRSSSTRNTQNLIYGSYLVICCVVLIGLWGPYNYSVEKKRILGYTPFWMLENNKNLKEMLRMTVSRMRGVQFAEDDI